MEDYNNENRSQFYIEDSAKSYLAETAKWAKFLSIVGFMGMGLTVIFVLFMGSIMSQIPGFNEIGATESLMIGSMSLIYILIAAIYFYPLWKLYQFAALSKKALVSNDSILLTQALEAQKSMFKFMGILVIITLSIYLVMILVGVFGFLVVG